MQTLLVADENMVKRDVDFQTAFDIRKHNARREALESRLITSILSGVVVFKLPQMVKITLPLTEGAAGTC